MYYEQAYNSALWLAADLRELEAQGQLDSRDQNEMVMGTRLLKLRARHVVEDYFGEEVEVKEFNLDYCLCWLPDSQFLVKLNLREWGVL